MVIKITQRLRPFKFVPLGKIWFNKDGDKQIAGFKPNWQATPYNYEKTQQHLNAGGNYGVLGGYDNLVIIDIDKKSPVFDEAQQLISLLPETFTVKTVSGGNHYYFISEDIKNGIRLKEDAGEVRTTGMMVIGPGVQVGNNKYVVEKDIPLAEITLKEVEKLFGKWIPNSEESKKQTPRKKISDKSRSAREFGVICRLIKKGKTKAQVYKEMDLYSKWHLGHPQYRELTYKKAQAAVQEKLDKKINEKIKILKDKIIILEEELCRKNKLR